MQSRTLRLSYRVRHETLQFLVTAVLTVGVQELESVLDAVVCLLTVGFLEKKKDVF